MSISLAHEQSQLLSALHGEKTDFAAALHPRGLQVYQANRAVLAERTLASTYPVIAQLIGLESFEGLARYFWQQHPPERGDMGQWGAHLCSFLAALPQLADEPFLADVARIEWALHCAAGAKDGVLDAASFAMLSKPENTEDATPVTLLLSPGVYLLASRYPVVSIMQAHLSGERTLAEAAELLGRGTGEHALVWRQGFKAKVRTTTAAEHTLIGALEDGLSIDAALQKAVQVEPDFDFAAWLAAAVQSGLVMAAQPVKT